MAWWPGWNSIDSADWWSGFYFWFGIVCLFLLGASEVVSHRYGIRKDELVATAESVANARRQQEQRETEDRHHAEMAELQHKAASAEVALANMRRNQTPRTLTQDQQSALIAATKPFSGQKFRISSIMGDDEGRQLAITIAAALTAAGWNHDGPNGILQVVYTVNPIGVEVVINRSDGQSGQAPSAAVALVETLVGLGLIQKREGFADDAVPPGSLEVRIGRKPPGPH